MNEITQEEQALLEQDFEMCAKLWNNKSLKGFCELLRFEGMNVNRKNNRRIIELQFRRKDDVSRSNIYLSLSIDEPHRMTPLYDSKPEYRGTTVFLNIHTDQWSDRPKTLEDWFGLEKACLGIEVSLLESYNTNIKPVVQKLHDYFTSRTTASYEYIFSNYIENKINDMQQDEVMVVTQNNWYRTTDLGYAFIVDSDLAHEDDKVKIQLTNGRKRWVKPIQVVQYLVRANRTELEGLENDMEIKRKNGQAETIRELRTKAIQGLCAWAQETSEENVTNPRSDVRYDYWVQEHGKTIGVACGQTILRLFGTWEQAKASAGLSPDRPPETFPVKPLLSAGIIVKNEQDELGIIRETGEDDDMPYLVLFMSESEDPDEIWVEDDEVSSASFDECQTFMRWYGPYQKAEIAALS